MLRIGMGERRCNAQLRKCTGGSCDCSNNLPIDNYMLSSAILAPEVGQEQGIYEYKELCI